MGPRAGLDGLGKSRLQQDFFMFSSILFVLHPTCFFVVISLHFAFLSLLTTNNTDIHALGGIRTRNPSKRSPADPHLRPLGHWDR